MVKASSHYRILSPICKLTSSPTSRAVIRGKSAGDRRSAIFMCELHNDASKRLADTSLTPTPNKYLERSADSTSRGVRCVTSYSNERARHWKKNNSNLA